MFQVACQCKLVEEATINHLINSTSLESRTAARISAIIITSNQTSMQNYIQNFIQIITNQGQDPQNVVRATLCLGEIGIF